jgi:hypothetical protein
MERVLRVLRTSFKQTPENALTPRESDVAARAWDWVRACMDGPVPPAHPSTGLPALQAELDEAQQVLGGDRLDDLARAVTAAAGSENPMADDVAELITEVALEPGVDETVRNPCVLVVRGPGKTAVEAWVREENLSVDVRRYGQVRGAMPWHHAVLFGPPERYVTSAWLSAVEAAATAGWLVTAPPARAVTILSWSGHGRLNPDAYAPWQGAPPVTIREEIVEAPAEDPVPEPSDGFTPVEPPTFAAPARETEAETAHAVHLLVDGAPAFAYFHPTIGPKPAVVSFAPEVTITRRTSAGVRPGMCLMFRTAATDRDALDDETRAWLAERHPAISTERAVHLQYQLKEAMIDRLDTVGSWRLVNDLCEQGLHGQYADTLPGRLLHWDFIAPQDEATYHRVCRALRLTPEPDAFRVLATFRTARQQAGLRLAARLTRHLERMDDLEDRLREAGSTVLTDEGIEGVALLVVRAVSTSPQAVPVSRLGALLNQNGRTWHR